jgi:Domain of unknown function (DUF2341)
MNMCKLIVNLVLIFNLILCPICLALFQGIKVRAVNPFKLTFVITNTGASAFVNYQQELFINTQALITGSKMRSDCGDMRFFANDGVTAINYFLEKGCNTTNTQVWVKIPSVAIGSSKVFMEFGDLALTTLSSAAGVMIVSDSMQTAQTCTVASTAAYDSVNKWMRLTATTANVQGYCRYTSNPGTNFRARFDFWTGGGTATGGQALWFYAYNTANPTDEDITRGGYHFTFDEFQDRICFTKSLVTNGAGISCGAFTTLDNSTWRTAEIRFDNGQASIYLDGVLITSGTATAPITTTGTRMGFGARSTTNTNEHRYQNSFVAAYSPNISANLPTETIQLSLAIRNSSDTVNINTCAFGTVGTTSTATCSYRLKVVTNATNGYGVYSQTSGNLTSGSYTFSNAVAGTGSAGGTLINATTLGTEMYGVKIAQGSATLGATALTLANSFNTGVGGSANNSVAFNHVSSTLTASSTKGNLPISPDTTNTILVTHNLNTSVSTPSGNYTQNIIYTVIPSF